jgi:hypothetical protein
MMSNPKVVRQRANRASFRAKVANTELREQRDEFGSIARQALCRLFAFDKHVKRLELGYKRRQIKKAKRPIDSARKTWRLSLRRRDRKSKAEYQEQLLSEETPVN